MLGSKERENRERIWAEAQQNLVACRGAGMSERNEAKNIQPWISWKMPEYIIDITNK